MRRCICSLVALLCVTVFLAGCGGSGGGFPMATDPYERPDTTTADRGFDLMSSAADAAVAYYNMTPDLRTWDTVADSLGLDVEWQAEDPYQGTVPTRGPATRSGKPLSATAIMKIARFMAHQRILQSTETIDTTVNGWHWTGSATEAGSTSSYSLAGRKNGTGTIRVSWNMRWDAAKLVQVGTVTADILRTDGKRYQLDESFGASDTDAEFWTQLKIVGALDGRVVRSASYSGAGSWGDGLSDPVTSWSGQESIVSEDGYWVNMRLTNGRLGSEGLDAGMITLTASDGFHAIVTLSGGAWNGSIMDSAGAQIGIVSGLLAGRYWTVTIGAESRDISYDY